MTPRARGLATEVFANLSGSISSQGDGRPGGGAAGASWSKAATMTAAVAELLLAEWVEEVALWAAGEMGALGSDSTVSARWLHECVLGTQ
jgi:hypothetical protein